MSDGAQSLRLDKGFLWTLVVGLTAVWLYTTPALHRAALFSALVDAQPLLIALDSVAYQLAQPESLVMYNCGLLLLVAGVFVALPSIALRRITLWSVLSLTAVTVALAIVGYWGAYKRAPRGLIDAGAIAGIVAACVLSVPWRRLRLLQLDAGSRIGQLGRVIIAVICVADVYVFGPMATGVWQAHEILPKPDGWMMHVLRMKHVGNPLDGKLVRIFFSTASYLVVQEYLPPTTPEPRRGKEALASGGGDIGDILAFARSDDVDDELLKRVYLTSIGFQVVNPLTIVDRTEVESMQAVLAPAAIMWALERVAFGQHVELKQNLRYEPAGVLSVDFQPTDENVCFGLTRSAAGAVVITTRPTTSEPAP